MAAASDDVDAKRSATAGRSMRAQLLADAVDGGWGSFVVLVAASLAVAIFVLVTVNRHGESYLATAHGPSRIVGWFEAWRTHGFFRYGGLLVYPEEDWQIYKTHSGSYLWIPYLVHRVARAVTGHDVVRAVAISSQLFVGMSSAVVGLLGMRLAKRIGAAPYEGLVLGACGAVVYQTFPGNLLCFLGMNPLTHVVMWASVFWVLVDDGALSEGSTGRGRRFVAAAMFCLTLSYSIATALFFVVSFALAVGLLAPKTVKIRHFALYVLVPLVAAKFFHQLQLWCAAWMVPNAKFIGNTNFDDFLFRSGLDGATEHYRDVWDVFERRWTSMGYIIKRPDMATAKTTAPLLTWKWLFLASVASVVANVTFAARDARARPPIVFLAAACGCYLLSLLSFTQGVIIHPDCWDVLALFPLVLSLFVVLPANLVRTGRPMPGFVLLVTLMITFAVSFSQMRTYATIFPVPPR